MSARRSTYDPVSRYLATGERVVWRHQPDSRTLFFNRLPGLVIVLLIGCFIAWVASKVVGNALPHPWPTTFSPWLIMPIIFIGFALFILYFYVLFIWRQLLSLLDSSSTHYALTDRRFLVVSRRGLIEYDASYFRQMQATDGSPGKQVLLFDWGPAGKRRTDAFRDRIAALDNAQKLEKLIRETLHP